MNKEFKKILLQIATLHRTDQKWILKQLTEEQSVQFNRLQGSSLLSQAQRFRGLVFADLVPDTKEPQLPALCSTLEQQEALFIAIILEQGQFSWQNQWLATHPLRENIISLSRTRVPAIKPATRLTLFQQWQTQLDFSDQLAVSHG